MGRFVHEAKSVSAFNHPGIITLYELGEDRDTEYVERETLPPAVEGFPAQT
ncbi:hypothetical protein BH20ACI3_BH20ACI3_23490 [soil metagenome]